MPTTNARPRSALAVVVLAAVLMAVGLTGGAAVAAPAGAAVAPRLDCTGLARVDFSHVPDAPSVVTSAAPVISSGHRYCHVRGIIAPQTRFEIKLPVAGWRGQYLQEGCGSLCGAVQLSDRPLVGSGCAPATNGELVLAADAGGRQALTLAQRYPAGNLAPLGGMLNPWQVRSNTDPGGQQVLTAEKLPALHAAVVRRCGDRNGIIADPRQCDFQPATIQCPAGTDAPSCLTPAQATAVRAFYRGPTDAAGHSLYNGGQPYGSELGWQGTFIAAAADTGAPGVTYTARSIPPRWPHRSSSPH